MRLIDADALQFEPDSHGRMNGVAYVHNSRTGGKVMILIQTALKRMITNAPTIDAVPVVHGRWLSTNDDNKKRCSRCDVIHLIAQYPHGKANYCPNCGAKMKKNV